MQRILLVEDNEMNRDLISRKLKRRGFEVLQAVDGAAGVDSALRERPDLVLMDIGLPVLDGYEATRLLKENAEVRDIPIIGLSAHAMSGDSEKAMAAGCDDYDTKPIEWPRLLGKIQSLLERAVAQAGKPAEPEVAEASDTRGQRRLLLIHDSPLHREMLAGRLSGHGFGLSSVSSGREALARLDSEDWDALLVDIGLGEVDGQPILSALRNHPKGQPLPILLLAPIDCAQEAASMLGEGADEVVLQPFRPEELLHRIGRLLDFSPTDAGSADVAGEALDLERRRTEHLARALLPSAWMDELRQHGKLPPRSLEDVAVLSLDFPDLETYLMQAGATEGLRLVQGLLVAFEGAAGKYGLFSSGLSRSSVLYSAGAHTGTADPDVACVRAGLEMVDGLRTQGLGLTFRFGIHRGPAVAAVLGRHTVRFGLWGHAVTMAERIRDSGRQAVYVSDPVWRQMAEKARGERVGELPEVVGGEAQMPVYRIDSMAG